MNGINSQSTTPAFDELYRTYAPRVIKLCLGYTGDYAQAQDLMQETFIRVWQNLPDFKGTAKVSTWIYRITVNTCLNHLRTTKRRATDLLQEKHTQTLTNETDDTNEQVQLLYQCISQLAETDRLIISLLLDDVAYPEIAQIMGISDGNLRVKIHRIKQQLIILFQRHGQF
jgi:RNA polymerase sigma-70 factor (ECF subfamily)